MRVGLVTFFRENYGSILQCYATKTYLEKKGIKCVVLERNYGTIEKQIVRIESIIKHAFKSIRYPDYFSKYFNMKIAIYNNKKIVSIKSTEKMNGFVDNILNPHSYTWSELRLLNKSQKYDAFICGSDQIWNASVSYNPFYYLRFCDKEKRIALAPSFGVSSIPRYNLPEIKKGINGFKRISVREETAQKIVSNITKISCTRISDPIFLLSEEEWRHFAGTEPMINNGYVFVYFLNEPCDKAINLIDRFCKANDLIAAVFSHKYTKYSKIANSTFIDGDPFCFVNLIAFSRQVFTDSFHATAFSIILKKRFLSFERNYLHKSSQSSRLKDLLIRFDALDHFVSKHNKNTINPFEIAADGIIKNEKELSSSYLDSELRRVVRDTK